MSEKRRVWARTAIAFGVLLLVLAGAAFFAQRRSDGPLNAILPGGPLRGGALVSEANIDWPAVLGDRGSCVDGVCGAMEPIELQLVEPAHSRNTGIQVLEGQLYIPCDLGFMWGRFSGSQRWVLKLIYHFKRWHEDALRDGRVVLRIDGKRYERQAVRVTDPELVARLRAQLEQMAAQWVAPKSLGAAPTEGPRDIWFFRIDPRPAG